MSAQGSGGIPSEDIVRWMMTHFGDTSGKIALRRLKEIRYIEIDIING